MEPKSDSSLSSLRHGVLEYCVLALLGQGERYGLELARTLGEGGILMGGEGTLYPLLSRLRKSGYVNTYWRESPSGPPRRYYFLTQEGREALTIFVRTWTTFHEAAAKVLTKNDLQ